MKGVNKVLLLGYIGKDPDVRSTNSNTLIANFSLATNEPHKDDKGNWQYRTEWHNLVAFGRTAEIVRDYLKKGSELYIEGKIQTRSWSDKATGQTRYATEILVNELVMLGSKDKQNSTAKTEDYAGKF